MNQKLKKAIWIIQKYSRSLFAKKDQNKNLVYRPVKFKEIILIFLTQVTVGENEGIESALRRFKRQVSKAGIFGELKRLRHHETPVEKYKRKLQQRRRSRRR